MMNEAQMDGDGDEDASLRSSGARAGDDPILKGVEDLMARQAAARFSTAPPHPAAAADEPAPASPFSSEPRAPRAATEPPDTGTPPTFFTFHPPEGKTTGAHSDSARVPSEESCVLIGPSNAGKTCTLAAFSAACYADARSDGATLSLVSDTRVDEQGRLGWFASDWIGRDQPPPNTDSRWNHRVQVTTHIKAGFFRPEQMISTWLHCGDGPGGALFPSRDDLRKGVVSGDSQEKMLAEAAVATTIVLVVDSRAPAVDLMETHLPSLFDRIAEKAKKRDDLIQPKGFRFLNRLGLGSRAVVDPRRKVGAARFLLLLTKIDVLALAAAKHLETQGIRASALTVAESLDPLGLAIDLLGPRTLRRIRRAIGLSAKFAVGVASANGFHGPTGKSFLDWSHGRPEDERLKSWAPFGIREALRFISTGVCTGPMQLVGGEHDLNVGGAVQLPSYPFGEPT